MASPILRETRRARKSVAPPATATHGDLVCPQCQAICTFSSAIAVVGCRACRWQARLSPTACREIVDALAGITDLNLPAYLRVLAVTEPPPVAAAPAGFLPYSPEAAAMLASGVCPRCGCDDARVFPFVCLACGCHATRPPYHQDEEVAA